MEKQKRYIIKHRKKSKYFALYLYMLLVMLLLTSVASYAWFSLNRSPLVSNMNVYITTAAGLELSPTADGENWNTYLDIYDTEDLKSFQGDNTPKPSLQQVSWADSEECFYKPNYGFDGRLTRILSWEKLSDDTDANLPENNYYIKATFYARSGQSTTVSLSEPKERDTTGTQGSGTFVKGFPDHTGKGPEVAIRVGMRMTYVDDTGTPIPGTKTGPMYIYEPNSNIHADGFTQGYVPTYSIHDMNQELVPNDRLIVQNFAMGDTGPGEFTQNQNLFELDPGEIVRIELYIWLEGQDYDCSNIMHVLPEDMDLETLLKNLDPLDPRLDYYTGNYRQIQANIQFTGTDESNQTALKPIG